jgi:glutathione-regulated potassium-efflux system ancillary protein KefC
MTHYWALAALWLGLALVATMLSIWLRVATALSEIVVGTIAQLIIGAAIGGAVLGTQESWVTFLSGTGAIVLTFLAGAELDPAILREEWKEATAVGIAGFVGPFLGCGAAAHYLLGWDVPQSWLAGVALSTTSVAVVYAVMLETGLNKTDYGKTLLAACFINDLLTVLALSLIFAPFTFKTLIFGGVSILAFIALPWLTPRFFKRFGGRPSELEAKYLFFCLFGLGALAAWAQSEAVLPAYVVGMVLAGTVGKDHSLVRRLRTLTFGFLTPFYFIRAGSFVSVPALWGGADRFRVAVRGQGADEDPDSLSRHANPSGGQARNGIYDAPHVDRSDLRHHLVSVRSYPPHYRPGAIFAAGRIRHWQRSDSNADRQRFLLAHHLLYGEDDIELEREGAGLGNLLFDNKGEQE